MRRYFVFLLPLVLFLLAVLHLQQVRSSTEQIYLNNETRLRSLAFTTALERYEYVLRMFLSETVRQPEIITLITQAVEAEGMERERLRLLLLKTLGPAYRRLQQFDVDQFQIHTADGHSFLRFHEPGHYNDYLPPYRPSLTAVGEDASPRFLFEVGRVFIGFRELESLTVEGRRVASVEVGVSFDKVRQVLMNSERESVYRFILKRDPIENRVLDYYRQQRKLLVPSALGNDYLMLDDSPEEEPNLNGLSFSRLSEQLRNQPDLRPRLAQQEAFTLGLSVDARHYTASFIPILDVQGTQVAWVVSCRPSLVLGGIQDDYSSALAVAVLLLILITLLLLILVRKHDAMNRQTRRMDAISNAVGDGIFVLDSQGRPTYVNSSACQLTGYGRQEMLAANIHHLIHDHGREEDERCPILDTLTSGEPYNGDERFRRADGQLMTVAVTSRAMRENGRISGVVTVFRDISERKAMEQRLERLATVDDLTGLLNRRALVEMIDRELRRIQRTGESSILMMIDFDHFKAISGSGLSTA